MSRIAIIGTGISGLSAAYLLNPKHTITVYEKASEIGGHTRTRLVERDGRRIPVDTGFIVFNYRNYPELSAMFKHLNVPVQKSNMSFGVTANNGALEWSAQSPNGLFGQRRNLFNPKFYRLLWDIVRFNYSVRGLVKSYPDLTLGQLIAKMGMGDWFSRYYILPMGGAIWSCPLAAILAFPARSFVEFFDSHGLLTVTQQPQWYTVTGGSQAYLARLTQSFAHAISTSCEVASVRRRNGKVYVVDVTGVTQEYDQAIFACHGDQALALLSDPTPDETDTLAAFTYQSNTAVLHDDVSIMPKRKRCWASWVYHADDHAPTGDIAVTYWMNQLQGIDVNTPLFVTLNPLTPVRPECIIDTHVFEHPVYTQASVAAQKRLPALQGVQNTWFCGAYHRNGFHEDGLASGIHVAKALGAEVPWH